MKKINKVEKINGVEVCDYDLFRNDSLKSRKEEKESLLVKITKSLLVGEWGGNITSIESGMYNVVLDDIDGNFQRTFYVNLIEGSVNVCRKDEKFVRKAIEFAKAYKRKGLGKFFVAKNYK